MKSDKLFHHSCLGCCLFYSLTWYISKWGIMLLLFTEMEIFTHWESVLSSAWTCHDECLVMLNPKESIQKEISPKIWLVNNISWSFSHHILKLKLCSSLWARWLLTTQGQSFLLHIWGKCFWTKYLWECLKRSPNPNHDQLNVNMTKMSLKPPQCKPGNLMQKPSPMPGNNSPSPYENNA